MRQTWLSTLLFLITLGGGAFGAGPRTAPMLEGLPDPIGGIYQPAGLTADLAFMFATSNNRAFEVSRLTGNRTRFSDSTWGTGPAVSDLWGICRKDANVFYAVDFRGADGQVIQITVREEPGAVYGDRVIISDLNSPGDPFSGPFAICYADNYLYVTEPSVGRILKIDATTGERQLLCGNDPNLLMPMDIEYHPGGYLVTVDQMNRTLVKVDPASGVTQVMSGGTTGFGSFNFVSPRGLAVEPSGSVLVANGFDEANPRFRMIRVDAGTGKRTVLSSNQVGTGPVPGSNVLDVCLAPDGKIYMADPSGFGTEGSSTIIEVDGITGNRTLVSGGARGTGPAFGLGTVVYGPRFMALSPVEGNVLESQIWHVDSTNGHDINGDGSAAAPWATIQHAIDKVQGTPLAPQYILVAEGPYMSIGDVVVQMEPYEYLYGGYKFPEWSRDIEANVTRIDGELKRRCVIGANNSIIEGFTISNGYSDPIYFGSEGRYGGGLFNDHANTTVAKCTFEANASGRGGGIFNWFSAPSIIDCRFVNNAGDLGAAISNYKSNPLIRDSVFLYNYCRYGGAAIENDESSPIIERCEFNSCRTISGGGAIDNYISSPIIRQSVFRENFSQYHGGAVRNVLSGALFENCVFWRNKAVGADVNRGGAMFNVSSNVAVTNCTFNQNQSDSGGGIFSQEESSLALVNSILWGDSPNPLEYVPGSSFTANYCNMINFLQGVGNITADPLFVDPDTGDLQLQGGSPCIDRANLTQAPPVDILGVPRPQGGGPDMGAYEATVQPSPVNRAGYVWEWLDVGLTAYGDRMEPFVSPLPPILQGHRYLRTLDADRDSSDQASLIEFTIDRQATIYVAIDASVTAEPNWLQGWSAVPDTLKTSVDPAGNRKLYRKTFAPGLVTLGGNRDNTATMNPDMYTVILYPDNTAPTAAKNWQRFE